MISQDLLDILCSAGLADPQPGAVCIGGDDPVFPIPYRIARASTAIIAATGYAAAEIWRARTGRTQQVSVEAAQAASAMRSNHYFRIDGAVPPQPQYNVSGFYRQGDGRWIYLHCRFANLRGRALAVLGSESTRVAVADAVARWQSDALETAIIAAGGCAALVRTEEQWRALPQCAAVAKQPLLEIFRIGDAPPEPWHPGPRPLSGIRALDLTRVLAGPTAARTLVEHGAEAMKIAHPAQADPAAWDLDLDTGLGKLSAFVDLRTEGGVETLRALARQSDVFSQSYRGGALAAAGFSPDALARLHPGIVYATLTAWGHEGPWQERRGFDTIVQAANGMAWRGEDMPAFMPVSAQDYMSGYLMAFGIMVALLRRAQEGGSWHVRVSLARTGEWLRGLGLLDPGAFAGIAPELPEPQLARYLMQSDSPVGRLTHLGPVVRMSETAPFWGRPAVPLGHDAPRWP